MINRNRSRSSSGKLAAAILLMGIGVGMVHVFLMPPFQNPDEIQHFLFSVGHAYDSDQMETVEAEVLRLLKKHKWFHFVGIGPGWENTQKISDIAFVFNFDPDRKSTRNTLFHYFYGKTLTLTGITDVLTAFYFLRLLSTLFFVLVLYLAFVFFKRYFVSRWQYYFSGMVLVFQWGTIMNAVNYDVFMVVLGSLFFICGYRWLCADKKPDLLFLALFAGVGALTKLVGFMFLIYLFFLLIMKVNLNWNLRLLKQSMLALLLFAVGFSWLNYLFPHRFYDLYTLASRLIKGFKGSLAIGGESAWRLSFFDSTADSFFFYTGWMGFSLDSVWYFILKMFLLVGFLGILWALVSRSTFPTLKVAAAPGTRETLPPIEAGYRKKWLAYLLLIVLMQLMAIWLYYGNRPMSQGRYLYPLIIPLILLIYSGLYFIEEKLRLSKAYLTIVFLLFQAMLYIFAIARIISVFYLEVASPHSGL